MRKFAVFCFLVAVLFSAATSHCANILPNPGFEDWIDTLGVQMPAGWFTSAIIDSNSAYKSTHFHGGSYSLALANPGTAMGFGTTRLSIVGGTHYDFSMFYDVPALNGAGAILLIELDDGDSTVGEHVQVLTYSSGWSQYSTGFDAHPAAVSIDVVLSTASDTIFFDDGILDGEPGTGVNERGPIRALANTPLLRISPNPCREMVTIVAVPGQPGGSELKIYDASGRFVRRYAVSGAGPVTVEWDGRDYASRAVPSGAYFIRLDSGSKTVCERIAVIR